MVTIFGFVLSTKNFLFFLSIKIKQMNNYFLIREHLDGSHKEIRIILYFDLNIILFNLYTK